MSSALTDQHFALTDPKISFLGATPSNDEPPIGNMGQRKNGGADTASGSILVDIISARVQSDSIP